MLHPLHATALDTAFHEISDPENTTGRFRQYLSKEAVAELVRPRPGAMPAVQKLFQGPTALWTRSAHGDLLNLEAEVSTFEDVFGVKMAEFRHPKGDRRVVRTVDEVLLPAALHGHVVSILGLSDLPPRPTAVRPAPCKDGCDFKVRPALRKASWNFTTAELALQTKYSAG